MKLKLPHTSGYYIDEFSGVMFSSKTDDVLTEIKPVNSFYKDSHPNSQLKHIISHRSHDQLRDTAANYLGFAKFDFDPRYHEVKVTSDNDLKPLANRLEIIDTEKSLLSEFAKHVIIAKYYAKRDDGVQLPKPFDRFFVYPDNTIIGHYFKYKKKRSLQYVDRQYLVFTAGTDNQPTSSALCSWQMLVYHEDGQDFVLPLTRDLIKGLYKDLTQNDGVEFKKYAEKHTNTHSYWDRKQKVMFFNGGDVHSAVTATTNNGMIQPTDDCRVLPFGDDKYYLDSARNLFVKQKDGTFRYRTFQKVNAAKDHWTLAVQNVVPGGRRIVDLWISRDLLAGLASGKFTLELAPTVHPVLAEGDGSIFDRVKLVPGSCLNDQGIAWLIANRAANDFFAAANSGANGLRAITEFKSGDSVYAIFRNNVVIKVQTKNYKIVSLPGLHSQYAIDQPNYRSIDGWTKEPLDEHVWDQIADLLSVEIPDDTDTNEFSNYDIITALEKANEKFLGKIPPVSDQLVSAETARVINQVQRNQAQVAYQYARTANWDTLNHTLRYLDELGLTLNNYHDATLRVSASGDAYWKSRGVLDDETFAQIKKSAEKYSNGNSDSEQSAGDIAVSNKQDDDNIESGSTDIIVKSIYDIRHNRKLKLKKKMKLISVDNHSLADLMEYAGIADKHDQFADYEVKFKLPNNHLAIKAVINQEIFNRCDFDQIVKKKQN